MSFYFASTYQNSNTSYTSLERKIAHIAGLALKPTDYDYLNVRYFDENIKNILFQMYAVMHDMHFPTDPKTYLIQSLLNPTPFEPIFHIVDKNEHVVHVFNLDQINTYFNSTQNIKVKQIEPCKKYLLEAKNTQPDFKNQLLTDKPIVLSELQTKNLLKLYVMCDHAIEHLLFYHEVGKEQKNFDLSHEHFGNNTNRLSTLISQTPKKKIDEIVYERSMKIIENSFNIKYDKDIITNDEQDSSSSSSDESDTDNVENINSFINKL